MIFLIIIFPGEHTDYNMGLVFPMALPLVTVVLGARSEDTGNDKCRLYSSSQVGDDLSRYISRKYLSFRKTFFFDFDQSIQY